MAPHPYDDMMPADERSAGDQDPAALYADGEDVGRLLYGDAHGGFDAYQEAVEAVTGGQQSDDYAGSRPSASTPSLQQYVDVMAEYDGAVVPTDLPVGRYTGIGTENGARSDPTRPETAENDPIDEFYAQFDTEDYVERMERYGLDPEDGWIQILDADETPLADYDELDGFNLTSRTDRSEKLDEQLYTELLDGGPEVYSSYGLDDDGSGYMKIAVVEHEMSPRLGGFTRIGEGVAHVNEAFYEVDKGKLDANGDPLDSKSVVAHEIGHNRFPWMTEMELRYHMGTPDRMLSWDANKVSRIGAGGDTGYMPWVEHYTPSRNTVAPGYGEA